jgi:hypothetical protein
VVGRTVVGRTVVGRTVVGRTVVGRTVVATPGTRHGWPHLVHPLDEVPA